MEMKYNQSYEGVDFFQYLGYLETIKNDIPSELYEFVSDAERHDFHEKSFHDSFVEEIRLRNDFKAEKSDMLIILSGENRKFTLYFYEIIRSEIKQDKLMDRFKDLITWEIGREKFDGIEKYYEEETPLVFRAMFSGYGEIEIYCKDIKIEETLRGQGKQTVK